MAPKYYFGKIWVEPAEPKKRALAFKLTLRQCKWVPPQVGVLADLRLPSREKLENLFLPEFVRDPVARGSFGCFFTTFSPIFSFSSFSARLRLNTKKSGENVVSQRITVSMGSG